MNLAEEFTDAVCSLTPERVVELQTAGIPEKVISNLVVGMTTVETYTSGLYEPRDEGAVAVIVPCGHHDGLNWVLTDLVAFCLGRPDRWWRRAGEGELLGDAPSEPVFPLRLHDTPLAWLRSGAAGAVIIDWRLDPDRLLYAGPLVVATPALKRRLERRIQQTALERFQISVEEHRHAA